MVTTKHRMRIEPQIINKVKNEKVITENHQTEKVVRNTREEEELKYRTTGKQEIKWQVLIPHISIVTLNVNGLNSSIKRHGLAGWIKKQDPTLCCLQETHLSSEDKHRLRVKGWKMILQAKIASKREQVWPHLHQMKQTSR